MLLGLFNEMRAAKVPVSVRELLDLINALKHHVVFADMDEFYYLARTVMVKDERHFDKFDRAFGAYFKGLENLDQLIEAMIPDDWLRKEFERMLTRSGIRLIKYWFSITDQEQQLRFMMRIHDPIRQWKLSPMDLQSRIRWEDYTKAKEDMLGRTNIPEAPWYVIEGNDKKRARLNCIHHLLGKLPYEEIPHDTPQLPERVFNPDYERRYLPDELYVPKVY